MNPATAVARSERNGTVYYFCAQACKARFDATPAAFAAADPGRRGESGERPLRRAAPAHLVDDGVAQRAIEPRHDALIVRQLIRARHHPGERILQDVFRQPAIADAPFEITEKRAPVLEQPFERRRCAGCVFHVHDLSIGLECAGGDADSSYLRSP